MKKKEEEEMQQGLITIHQVAQATGMGPGFWYRRVGRGDCPLPPIRLGRALRFRRADLEAFLLGQPIRSLRRGPGRPSKEEQMIRARGGLRHE